MGTRVVVYCTKCNSDMGMCREDVPDLEPETIIEMWNTRHAESLAGAAERWIDCNDRMPEIEQRVLITFARQGDFESHASIAEWNGAKWDNANWTSPAERESITHWMEMPAPAANAEGKS